MMTKFLRIIKVEKTGTDKIMPITPKVPPPTKIQSKTTAGCSPVRFPKILGANKLFSAHCRKTKKMLTQMAFVQESITEKKKAGTKAKNGPI